MTYANYSEGLRLVTTPEMLMPKNGTNWPIISGTF
jgi:hypothetical protein